MISVYYDSPYITIIQETELVNFDTLIGIVGGQLGLCIGVSFLSLAETAEMMLNLLKVLIFHLFNSLICKLNRFVFLQKAYYVCFCTLLVQVLEVARLGIDHL